MRSTYCSLQPEYPIVKYYQIASSRHATVPQNTFVQVTFEIPNGLLFFLVFQSKKAPIIIVFSSPEKKNKKNEKKFFTPKKSECNILYCIHLATTIAVVAFLRANGVLRAGKGADPASQCVSWSAPASANSQGTRHQGHKLPECKKLTRFK